MGSRRQFVSQMLAGSAVLSARPGCRPVCDLWRLLTLSCQANWFSFHRRSNLWFVCWKRLRGIVCWNKSGRAFNRIDFPISKSSLP